MKKGLAILVVTLLGVGVSVAGAELAITVLDVDPGVQALGIGGAAVSLQGSPETLYYNAAGLATLSGASFSSSYVSHLGLASYSAFGLAFRNWGIGFLTLGAGDISGYDASGGATGTLSYGSNAFLFGFGIRPSDLAFLPKLPFDFALGGRLKYVSVASGTSSGSGFAVDLAYRMSFPDLRLGPLTLANLGLGITASNLLGSIGFTGGHSETMRMGLRVGVSAEMLKALLVATDFDLAGRFHLGVQYRVTPVFAIRGGMMTQGGGVAITLGLGASVAGFVIDYAFVTHPQLGASHRVALTLDFSTLDLSAIGRSLGRLIR